METNVLRELQLLEIDCVKEVQRICEECGIRWMLGYGSVLGAVRHKGFIPWDDDMDILMFEEDYKKFEEACKKKLDKERFFLQTYKTDVNYPYVSAKIRLNNTCSMPKEYKDIAMHWGICIDIFTIRYAPSRKRDRKRMELIWKINEMVMRSSLTDIKSVANPLKRFIKKIEQWYRTPKRIGSMIHMMEMLSKKTDKKEVWIDGEIRYFPAEIFEETLLLDFEGDKFPCPAKTHECLKISYGDYMKLPPEEERCGHGDIIVDLQKSYKEYQ